MPAYDLGSELPAGPLAAVVEQLWRPALATGDVRLVTGDDPEQSPGDEQWHTVEAYRAVPSVAHARLLVPEGSRRLAAAAVGNYRALLTTGAHARRTALTVGSWAGLPLVSERVALQARRGVDACTPVTTLRTLLGEPDLHAAMRVNLNTNRKATLQLLDSTGHPLGLAKFAWEPLSVEGVRREAAALRDLATSVRVARVPALRALGEHHDRPVVVAAPLPTDVRGDGPRRRPPTAVEIHDLLPLTRRAPARQLAMCRALANRLHALAEAHPQDATVGAARALLTDALASEVELPAAHRWHGDFTPWNAARDGTGTLWVWDWETSELDAPAGMDALHWAIGVRQETHGDRWDGAVVLKAQADAAPVLRALGISRAAWPTLTAIHVAALAERVLAHALGDGGWQESWMLRPQLDDMVRVTRQHLHSTSESS
ncbi:hypothetical protein [Nocardioides daphniae]|uniref:Aminoglycoside phosphotransferase domain-containing protein n=1 Tax=Nocardioides daphniae TaxID=402297 RepID=A0A4P7UAG9_9ACTN|nr:hypothetical protein [Nocardioides daphniae]QCC76571.1 hypothetical protein E2C04_03905 [Nocardioides daphniae]GGD05238.1 hypothetical protein GCM10007231_00020 [Nocardioides daphniae]